MVWSCLRAGERLSGGLAEAAMLDARQGKWSFFFRWPRYYQQESREQARFLQAKLPQRPSLPPCPAQSIPLPPGTLVEENDNLRDMENVDY